MFEHNYLALLEECLANGELVKGRNGYTHSMFGATLEFHDLEEGAFPILTTRKMYPQGIFGELAAFIRGATDLATFKKFGCNYWDANAAAWVGNLGLATDKFSVGRIYGAQWRDFNGFDQLKALVTGLRKAPTSRRHVLTSYNPAEVHKGCLPPCHLLAQYSVRRGSVLESVVYMRSVDLVLGLPTDVVLYATLQLLLAHELNLHAGAITFMMGDAHIYENHTDQVILQLERQSLPQPVLELASDVSLFDFRPDDAVLKDYQHHDPIPYEFNV
jgi:thymidylate synthase